MIDALRTIFAALLIIFLIGSVLLPSPKAKP